MVQDHVDVGDNRTAALIIVLSSFGTREKVTRNMRGTAPCLA